MIEEKMLNEIASMLTDQEEGTVMDFEFDAQTVWASKSSLALKVVMDHNRIRGEQKRDIMRGFSYVIPK